MLFALAVANPGANRGERIRLADDLIGFLVPSLLDQRHVPPGFGFQRASRLAGRADQVAADKGVTPLVKHMPLVFVAEMAERGQHGIGCGLPQAAHRRVFDDQGQFFEQLEMFGSPASPRDVVQDLVHPLRALAAGEALAARLVAEKVHKVLGDVHHARRFIHHDHPAGTHDRTGLGQRVVVDRQIKPAGGNAAAGRAAGLHCLDLRLARRPAADVVDDLADRDPHRHLDQSGVLDFAHQAEDLGAGVVLRSDGGVLLRALVDDHRDVGPRFHVVDHRRFPLEALLDGKGRALPRFAHAAFERVDQGRFFAAHESAGATHHLDVERETCAQDVLAQQAELARLPQGDVQMLDRQRVFAPHIHNALRRSGGVSPQQHPFENAVGIAFQDAAIHVGPRIALVGVADQKLAPLAALAS